MKGHSPWAIKFRVTIGVLRRSTRRRLGATSSTAVGCDVTCDAFYEGIKSGRLVTFVECREAQETGANKSDINFENTKRVKLGCARLQILMEEEGNERRENIRPDT